MTNDKFHKLLPVAGIISALLIVAAIFVVPGAPQTDATNHAKVIAYYTDHETGVFVSSILGLLAMFFFAPLLTELRVTLRSGEAAESIYSTLTLIGGLLFMAGTALMAFTGAVAAGTAQAKLGPASILSSAIFADYAWMPWVMGMAVLQWAVGLGGLRTATLPKWLSWFSIVLGVLCLGGPTGIAVFFLSPIWVLALSIALMRKPAGAERAVSATAAPAAA